ncbi:MAG: hypothetical protein LBE57_03270 [Methanosarcinales archaeon]|nr:hypothetical protein [Methanosarcinales archaeon]
MTCFKLMAAVRLACICSLLSHPFAYANVAAGYLAVSVSAVTLRVCVACSLSSVARARAAHFF